MIHDPRICPLGDEYSDKPRVCHACSALWVAAPYLVDALERAIEIIEGEWPGLWDEGRAAIEKTKWVPLGDAGPKQSWGDTPDEGGIDMSKTKPPSLLEAAKAALEPPHHENPSRVNSGRGD